MARTAAQQAAFEKCVAAREKAKAAKMSPPEYVAVPKEDVPPEPVVEAPTPEPEPEVPPAPPASAESDDDFDIIDGNELISIISKQQQDLEAVRAELLSLKDAHTTSLTELSGRYTDLSDSFAKARIQAANSINFV